MKRTLTILIATMALAAAGATMAGNPNPMLSQDPYWDLPDQGAAWSPWRAEQAKAAARKAAEQAPKPAPTPAASRG